MTHKKKYQLPFPLVTFRKIIAVSGEAIHSFK